MNAYYSLPRAKRVGCGRCRRVCPMDVDVTECILRMERVKNCPRGAL